MSTNTIRAVTDQYMELVQQYCCGNSDRPWWSACELCGQVVQLGKYGLLMHNQLSHPQTLLAGAPIDPEKVQPWMNY